MPKIISSRSNITNWLKLINENKIDVNLFIVPQTIRETYRNLYKLQISISRAIGDKLSDVIISVIKLKNWSAFTYFASFNLEI